MPKKLLDCLAEWAALHQVGNEEYAPLLHTRADCYHRHQENSYTLRMSAELENMQHINQFICDSNCLHLSFTAVQVTVLILYKT
jgi:hypothetical protein